MFLFLFQEESLKWSQRGQLLLQNNKFLLAEQCANFALYFRTSLSTRVQALMCRAFAQFELGKSIGARNDINEVRRLNSAVAKVRKILSLVQKKPVKKGNANFEHS